MAADAAPSSGAAVRVKGRWVSEGGTSLATPVWASMTALIDQYLRSRGDNPVGFANPVLYRLASHPPPLPGAARRDRGLERLLPGRPRLRHGDRARITGRDGIWPAISAHSPDGGGDPMTRPDDPGTSAHDPLAGTGDTAAAPLPRVTCPHCGARVPDAPFCGSCGAHLAHTGSGNAARRAHAYSAFPDEAAVRLAVVSSLFPQLSGRSRGPFRIAFALVVAALLIVAVAGLEAPVIAISALAIPLLFLVYVYEIDPLEIRFALPTTIIFLVGAALGVGWGLLLGPLAADSLLPSYSPTLLTGGVLVSAVAVPVVGQLLMALPRRGGAPVPAGPERGAGRVHRRGGGRAGPHPGRHPHRADAAAAQREHRAGLVGHGRGDPGGDPRHQRPAGRRGHDRVPGRDAVGAPPPGIRGRRSVAHLTLGGPGVRAGRRGRAGLRRRRGPPGRRPAGDPPGRGGARPAGAAGRAASCAAARAAGRADRAAAGMPALLPRGARHAVLPDVRGGRAGHHAESAAAGRGPESGPGAGPAVAGGARARRGRFPAGRPRAGGGGPPSRSPACAHRADRGPGAAHAPCWWCWPWSSRRRRRGRAPR